MMTALTCSLLSCAASDWSETNGLAVRITADRSVMHPGDALQVSVELRNTSTHTLVLRSFPCPWDWLIFSDGTGKEFASYPNTIPSLLPASPDQFVLLAPGKRLSGVLVAKLVASHSISNQHWKPRFMRLVAGTRDYDLPAGVASVHFLRRAFPEDQVKLNGTWQNFSEYFQAPQWLGEIKSATVDFIATAEQPTTPRNATAPATDGRLSE